MTPEHMYKMAAVTCGLMCAEHFLCFDVGRLDFSVENCETCSFYYSRQTDICANDREFISSGNEYGAFGNRVSTENVHCLNCRCSLWSNEV